MSFAARSLFGACTLVLVLGGRPTAAQWRDGPPLADARWHAAAAAHGSYVFAFGGRMRIDADGRYRHGVDEFGLDYYDPAAGRWLRAPPMPPYRARDIKHREGTRIDPDTKARRAGVSLVPVASDVPIFYELPFGASDTSGRVHVFTHDGPVFFDASSRTWGQQSGALYHFTNRPWEAYYEGTAPNWRRSGGATATDDEGRIYLVGGYGKRIYPGPGKPRGRGAKLSDIVAAIEIYNPRTDSWAELAPMKRPRQVLSAAVADGKLFVFGGCSCLGVATYKVGDPASKRASEREVELEAHPVAVTEMFDLKSGKWHDRAPMPTPRVMASAATGKDGKIYVIGGAARWNGEALATVEIYDPKTDRWSKGPPLRVARLGHASAVTGDGHIWVIGGIAADPGVGDIPRYLTGDRGGPTRSVEILATGPETK